MGLRPGQEGAGGWPGPAPAARSHPKPPPPSTCLGGSCAGGSVARSPFPTSEHIPSPLAQMRTVRLGDNQASQRRTSSPKMGAGPLRGACRVQRLPPSAPGTGVQQQDSKSDEGSPPGLGLLI